MASEVEICNAALSKIGISGNNRITSLSQNTKNAKACDERYATLRDLLLEQHPWNFALKRVQLAASTEAPSYEFTYAYSCRRIGFAPSPFTITMRGRVRRRFVTRVRRWCPMRRSFG